jgi:hypothetical protein
MVNEHQEIKKAVAANCRLLNDALEIELRKSHEKEAVVVDRNNLKLIQLTTKYTRLYIDLFSLKH